MKAQFEDEAVEKLIWDNASTDGTADWLMNMAKLYPNVHVTLAAKNEGVAGGRHQLFPQAKGDVIVSLDSDVRMLRDGWLDAILQPLQDSAIGIVGALGFTLSPDWNLIPVATGKQRCDILSGFCHAFRRDALQHVAIDTDFNHAGVEDDDFCFQFIARGQQVWQVTVPIRHEFASTWTHGIGDYRNNRQRLREKWQERLQPGVPGEVAVLI